MTSPVASSAPPSARPGTAPPTARPGAAPPRIVFLGSAAWLDGCCPPDHAHGIASQRIELGGPADLERALQDARRSSAQVTVVFDPPSVPDQLLGTLGGVTLGVIVGDAPPRGGGLYAFDRLVSFRPSLTGVQVGATTIWRAIPPPIADDLFAEVRPLHTRPRAMAVGRSTAHRERMLMPVKHHHDLLQVLHGVSGAALAELLGEYDVGIYVAPGPGGGFGQQIGMHLAAGQLLLAETLTPAHGLERNIDYLHVDSAEAIVWVLQRLARFPEMYHRIRVRGRLKAEQYRASRVFARIAHDLLADVAAFGSTRAARV